LRFTLLAGHESCRAFCDIGVDFFKGGKLWKSGKENSMSWNKLDSNHLAGEKLTIIIDWRTS
jgi:hypothetical protein